MKYNCVGVFFYTMRARKTLKNNSVHEYIAFLKNRENGKHF